MRSAWFPSLLAAALGVALVAPGFAEDPAPPGADESARVRHLIDDLGSDDFRVREGAQRALKAFGARALPALRAAASHENAEVRFRAEQLVRTLEGAPAERPLGREDGGLGRDDGGLGGGTLGGGREDDDADRQLGRMLDERIRRHLREMQERMRQRFGGPTPFDFDFGLGGAAREQGVFESESGARGARLEVKPGAVRLAVREKGEDGAWKDAQVLEAGSVEELRRTLAQRPELSADADVASVLRQATSGVRLRMPEFRWEAPDFGSFLRGGGGAQSRIIMNGVQIEQSPGHAKVTVTENGPDGKPVTKTFEGKDLDEIKRAHPELEGRLGGIRIEIGRGAPGTPGFGAGPDLERWLGPWLRERRRAARESGADDDDPTDDDDAMDDDDAPGGLRPDDDVGPAPGAAEDDQTGPFGLQISPVEPVLRDHLGLGADAGALVRVVRAGSAAARLGLRAHDVVVGVEAGSTRVEKGDFEALAGALRAAGKEGPLTVHVVRAGKPLTLSR